MEIIRYKLTDVCDFQGGSQPPKNEWSKNKEDGFVRMLQIRDFTQREKDNIEYVRDSNRLKKCQKEDVLIGRYGASIGKILTGLEGAYNVAIMKAIPNEKFLNRQYLLTLLRGPVFQNFIQNIGGRAAQAGFNKKDLGKYSLSLPSLDNQKRIAQVLSNGENLIKKRKESIGLLDELLKSTFLEMFKNNKGKEYRFNDLADKTVKGTFSNGPFGSDLLSSELQDQGVPVIYIRDLKNGEFNWKSNVFVTADKAKTLDKCQIRSEDILIAKVGTPPGTTTIYPKGSESGIITQDVIRLRVNNNFVLPTFIKFWMNSDFGKFRLKSIIVQGTRQRFSLGDFKKLKINIPIIEKQLQFDKIVEKVESLKQQYQIHLQELESLYGSFSQIAFNGELDLSKVIVGGTLDEETNDDVEEIKIENEAPKKIEKYKKEKLITNSSKKNKVDITNTTYLDFIGMPIELQRENYADDYSMETTFTGEKLFAQFYLKDNFKNKIFTVSDVQSKFNSYFIPKGQDFNYDIWKDFVFSFINSERPLLKQIFDESDNTVKLKLTDEAFKA